jgi:hypothetical protein
MKCLLRSLLIVFVIISMISSKISHSSVHNISHTPSHSSHTTTSVHHTNVHSNPVPPAPAHITPVHRTESTKTSGSALTSSAQVAKIPESTKNTGSGLTAAPNHSLKLSSIPAPPPMIKSDTSLRTESMRPRGGEYSSTREKYTGSGKQNKKAGFGVIGGFVSGWILFFVSICFICWNERKSVKDTEALDYLEVTCHDGTKGTLSTDPKNKNFALFCGTGQVVKPAEITNLGLFSNKTAYISTTIVKYAGTELVIEKNDDGEETGRKEKEMWIDHNEDLERILAPEYKGELLVVENNIKFDTNLIADKSKPYRFEYDKTAVFEAFLKSNNWRYNSDNYYCA